jgi:O-antigen ligase
MKLVHNHVQSVLLTILNITEYFLIFITIYAFWHVSPPIRDNWVWLLGLAVPIHILRILLTKRFNAPIWILPLFVAFWILTMVNFTNAPYHRDYYWVLVCRPLLGCWIILYAVEWVSWRKTLIDLLFVSVVMGLIVGMLGLTSSQWHGKSDALRGIIETLPRLPHKQFLPDAQLSFNPNEIAGAIAWLVPLCLGLAFISIDNIQNKIQRLRYQILKSLAVFACLLLSGALVLGQSRFAIFGVLGAVGLMLLIWLWHSARRTWRWFGLGLLVVVLLGFGQAWLITQVPDETTGTTDGGALSSRDASSVDTRLQMWQRALQMASDYPLTGVGMSMFRFAIGTPAYQIPYFEEINFNAPHAHNELLQMGADFGYLGMVWWLGLQVGVVYGLGWAWRNGNQTARAVAIAVGAGLLAHAVYGLGDAVTLWDRFGFLWWWLMGLGIANYVWVRAGYGRE